MIENEIWKSLIGISSRMWKKGWIRGILYIFLVIALWQVAYVSKRFPPILFPSIGEIAHSFLRDLLNGSMLSRIGFSLKLILYGMIISATIAMVLTLLAMASKNFKSLVTSMISIFDPLPGIALLPLAILWIGIGEEAIIFIMIHSIIWPMLLNVIGGFSSVPAIYRDLGYAFGLKRNRFVFGILIPASIPSILTGFKTGWSRAWRALISAEMVFGATGSSWGIGWDIYLKRSYLDMAGMFASLLVIMIIGIVVENLIFKTIERVTVIKWGMAL